MPSFIANGPFPLLVAFLTGVVFCRAQGTYWLARWVSGAALAARLPEAGWRRRAYNWVQANQARGVTAIERVGWVVIPLSFLTVGFQTVVNAGAGVLRMPWLRYTLAMLPGCPAWAVIYATIGLAAWQAALAAAAGSWWGIAALAGGVAVVVATVVLSRRRARAHAAQARKLP